MEPADHRERRKQVRPRLRRDLRVTAQQYEGRRHYIVKDPVSLRYYRLQEPEHFLAQQLDGRRTLEEVQKAFEKQHRPRRLSLVEVEAFAQQLVTAGLIHQGTTGAGSRLLDRRRRQRRDDRLASLTNVLTIQLPLCDPDRLLGRLLPALGWLFTPWCLILVLGLLLTAALLVATHFDIFRGKLPAYHEFFSFRTVAYLWVALGIVKIVHELAHGLCCKAFGGEVHEMGLLLLCLSPALYCNVSDAWTLPNKWRRILISFAGIYAELVLAALATLVWWHSSSQPFVNHLSLSVMLVCGINTVVFNGNPLMRYDGYYILADWLEVPNLGDRARRFLQRLVMAQGLGMRLPCEAPMARWRRALFVAYALLSTLYRWVVTVGVLWFLYLFLKPYKLGPVAALFAVAAVASMVGWPLYQLGKGLYQHGRLPEMRPERIAVVTGSLVAGLLGFFLVPLPICRVHQIGLVEVRPEAWESVFVQTPGILQRLYVREGQRVEPGELLAEFRSLDLETLRAEVRTEYDTLDVQLRALREMAAAKVDPRERAHPDAEVARTLGARARSARQAEVYEKLARQLQLRAPRAGVVLGLPRIEEVGKYWDRDEQTPFCAIGDPSRLWVQLPVSPANYRLLQEDRADLSVAIRIPGRGGRTWAGQIARLPQSEAREVPLPLTQKAGGPLAVKPGEWPSACVPQSQQYLVGIALLDPDGAVCPGTLAPVVIRGRWRPAAWWVWRALSSTFDLGLV
jgi:putative peptide zinc metalloprotease protein